ncbi:MAG: folylpolyglutamate synthase/dihydrofolate synthase family protein [Thermodesulfovibrionales bacterium]
MKDRGQITRVDQTSYNESIDYLFGLQHHGIKLGLDNIRRILDLLNNPQGSFRAIHIAGTNGKGSTASFIASVLSKAGYRVGLFTSPHLVSFTERIQVNGNKIDESEVVKLTSDIRGLIKSKRDLSPTFFEFVTAMAFRHFKNMDVEWAVVETGMGGRLDSTNVLTPDVTVITPIGMDHTEFLGDTLKDIAREKAGIIKSGIPIVTGHQTSEAGKVIDDISTEKHAHVYRYGTDFDSRIREAGIAGTRFDYTSVRGIEDIFIPLCGEFQAENASVAIKALELICDKRIDADTIREGLSSTRWEGRCELFNWNCPILFDGAHNTDAARTLSKTLRDIHLKEFKDIIFVIGSMGDKDIEGFLSILLPLARFTVFTTLNFERAARAVELKSTAEKLGYGSIATGTMAEALDTIDSHYRKGDLVVVTGSFYTVGEAKGLIGHDSSLFNLTEFR